MNKKQLSWTLLLTVLFIVSPLTYAAIEINLDLSDGDHFAALCEDVDTQSHFTLHLDPYSLTALCHEANQPDAHTVYLNDTAVTLKCLYPHQQIVVNNDQAFCASALTYTSYMPLVFSTD